MMFSKKYVNTTEHNCVSMENVTIVATDSCKMFHVKRRLAKGIHPDVEIVCVP
ncbi:MAG: hypothetical protein II670_00420 [Alphaproteobacteria bacterium]|nr:hypothetical protein [Alphaproteobacteria bacterium]